MLRFVSRQNEEGRNGGGWQILRNRIKYNADKLVWFEEYDYVWDAIAREKEIKGWRREKKVKLIESKNPDWEDVYPKLLSRFIRDNADR